MYREYKIITTKFNFFIIISKFIASPNLANYQKGKSVISYIMILDIDIFLFLIKNPFQLPDVELEVAALWLHC